MSIDFGPRRHGWNPTGWDREAHARFHEDPRK